MCYKTDYEAHPLLQIGQYGRALGQFNEPSGITKDGDDIILVADSRNDRIQVSLLIYRVGPDVCAFCLERPSPK